MALSHVKLGTAFQSIEGLVSEGSIRFRLVVSADMLRRDLGAGEDPKTWMRAFNDHAMVIERAATKIFRACGGSVIILQRLEGPKDL